MVIDPIDNTHLFVGTDIGVLRVDRLGRALGAVRDGLPVVPIFDMAIAQPGTGSEVLRVATHGRGMYEASIGSGGAALTVHKARAGGGTVTSDDGHINCGGSCSFVYTPGDTVDPDRLRRNARLDVPRMDQLRLARRDAVHPDGEREPRPMIATFDSNDTTKPTAKMLKPAKTLQSRRRSRCSGAGRTAAGAGSTTSRSR